MGPPSPSFRTAAAALVVFKARQPAAVFSGFWGTAGCRVLPHLAANVTRRNMSTGARAMATALVLEADGRRDGGRWKRGSVLGDDAISESANSGWKDRLKEAGIVLDFKPDLANAVLPGDFGRWSRWTTCF